MVLTRAQRQQQEGETNPSAAAAAVAKKDNKSKRQREEGEEETKEENKEEEDEGEEEDRKPAAKTSAETAAAARKKSRRVTREPRNFLDPREDDEEDAAMKEFLIQEFDNSGERGAHLLKPQLWNTLSKEWQTDRDVAAAALKYNCVRVCDLTLELQDDKDLLLEAVAHNSNQWFHLPYHFKFDPDFPKAITHYSNRILAGAILEQFLELRQDPDIWDVILDSGLPDSNGLIKEYFDGNGAELRASIAAARNDEGDED